MRKFPAILTLALICMAAPGEAGRTRGVAKTGCSGIASRWVTEISVPAKGLCCSVLAAYDECGTLLSRSILSCAPVGSAFPEQSASR